MNRPDLEASLDDLLSLSPDALANEFAELLESLDSQVASQRFAGGPTIPPVSTDLDADQWALIDAPEPTLRLIAPAGSGKTHSIVNKVLALIHTGTRLERIVLVTFDNASKQ
jgi:DNA helicase-2/ATP-dependent DNA helicase PcrA